MKFIPLTAAAASLAYAEEYVRCKTEPTAEKISMLNEAASNASAASSEALFSIAALRNVDTYVHVVTTSAKAGRYSQAQVNEQVSRTTHTVHKYSIDRS